MKDLAKKIEMAWMGYNAAVVSRLHVNEAKQQLSNIMINNVNDIIKALNSYTPETAKPAEMTTTITGDEGEPPRKTRKKGDADGER